MQQVLILTNFLKAVILDPRIGTAHISLYCGLLKLWQEQNYKNPFLITRRALMPVCKISGCATYHSKIKDLHQFGYIVYTPSYNYYEGSQVWLKELNNETLFSKKS